MGRGQLRIYLGAAPGVGKTYAMLEEAHRRRARGTDVVIGVVEPHGRARTAELIAGLEVVPRRTMTYRGATFEELDVDAVLRRDPEVVLVDELAHTNVPGSRNAKRWQDIEELLAAGITVLSTVNIQHLESLNDVVERIAGVPQRETVPDEVVRRADQVELVDMTPEALRRRMAHGNVYAPEQVDAALGNYFRVGNLTALRELALLWLADQVDDHLDRYRADHHIDDTWEARERVVVALTGGAEGETLIRRATRIAARGKGADLMAVHVLRSDGLVGADPTLLARQRLLVESLGGTYHQVLGDDVPAALIEFARGVNATQLVLGASRRGRLAHLFSRGVALTTMSLSGSMDVHLVPHRQAGRGRTAALGSPLSRRRRLAGYALAVVGLPLLVLAVRLPGRDVSLATGELLLLAMVIAAALVGGMWPALLAAVAGFALLNWFFTEPIHSFEISQVENIVALAVFLLVAASVSIVVDTAARRTREAARASADAQSLAAVAGSMVGNPRPLIGLLERLLETYGLTSVTLLERAADASRLPGSQEDPSIWSVVACVGERPSLTPADGDVEVPIDDTLSLALRGPALPAEDRRVIEAFAAQAALALRQERLTSEAASAGVLAEADRMRTALLAAVGHDLRTPLAAAKAAVTSLRSDEVQFDDDDRAELLETADESLDRLTALITNLLDLSRLQAGVLGVSLRPTAAEGSVARALDELGEPARKVTVDLPAGLPRLAADPALLERVLVNVIGNALRFSPPDRPPVVTARADGSVVELRVVDHGPGIPAPQRDRMFVPFQRLDDSGTGIGLGLALSRGLTEAMGGTLVPETTDDGGLTMRLTLPVERAAAAPAGRVVLDDASDDTRGDGVPGRARP
ncbi:sensor histidine kinase [Jiangella anatolica]|uniref:histidine kinase n=1 Tax=Jiangella anatolica TaxID=2670374 RepID=A0A2W2B0P0_9ACTN|nr:sensor histidine kinase KdpD [Jiangella anatolica]PZF80981.1 histidine kinase [Jiangella anatolica]